jgi:hypothetical protein
MAITIPGLSSYLAACCAKEKHAKAVLTRAAESLVEPLGGDAAAVVDALEKIQWGYLNRVIETEDIENAAQAKKDLLNLAKKASELEAAMFALGRGAWEVMCRRTVRRDLIADADPGELPDPDPHPLARMSQDPETGEWEVDNGRWVTRLHALAELARVKADRIEEQAGRGGRTSFGARLHGSPEEWLARACKEFAEAHGCESQAVALKMVQAVMEAEHGREAMKKMDGKPSKDKGRKAVRKVAQTKPKTGTV